MKGSCLCGAVSFVVDGPLEHQPEACHCSQCRKQTSHVFVGVNVRRNALTVHGGDLSHLVSFIGEGATRVLFGVRISTVLNPTKEGYEFIGIAMGAFEPPTGVRLAKHIFVGDKGDYYEVDDGLPQSQSY